MEVTMRFVRFLLCLALWLTVGPRSAPAADAPTDSRTGSDFYESRIRPVLVKNCYECHSAESGKAKGGLRLDSMKALRQGGDRGPAVVPGDPSASWMLTAASHVDPDLKMPPKRDRLPDTLIADLRRWIEIGAPGPREVATGAQTGGGARDGRGFWGYQRPTKHVLPRIGDRAWPRQDLDHFVLAALEKNELAQSPDAESQVVLRRLHFDLVGLPPSPSAVVRFVERALADGLDRALALEADELLASPRFGERWGRHWLDVARYAESSGKEANISFPYAWRYRDYVIDCVNADMPFDQFLTEQIAGDLLPHDTSAERARLLIATGFLAVGPKNLDEMNELQFRADVVDEQIDTVTRAVMGSSIACARCHDHKFDPITMEDYYALAGIFASTKTYFGTAVSPANRVGGDPLPLPAVAGQAILQPSIPAKRVQELKAELAALRKESEDRKAAVYKAIAAGKDPGDAFTLRDALRIFWRSGGIEGELEKVDDSGHALPLAMGVLDGDQIHDAPLLKRGEIGRPGERVPRALPRVIAVDDRGTMPSAQSGRLELARWLAHPDHPLTSRVIVNRIWRHLFGAGIVATVDDFGSTGALPSHPELLDDLAVRLVQEGWSLKRLVRTIVLSRAYRQASTYNPAAFQRDPDNRLLWRASKRRLEAEAIRDAMLAVSGKLDPARPEGSLVARVIGDKPISLIGLDKRLPADLDGSRHRSVYLPVIRNRLPDALDLFDFAEPSLVTGDRETTNVPTQALFLMNGPFVRDQAEALADRLLREAAGPDQVVRRAFLLCFSRTPLVEEERRATAFVNIGEPPPAQDVATERAVLARFCQALLSTAEFRNLD